MQKLKEDVRRQNARGFNMSMSTPVAKKTFQFIKRKKTPSAAVARLNKLKNAMRSSTAINEQSTFLHIDDHNPYGDFDDDNLGLMPPNELEVAKESSKYINSNNAAEPGI